MQFSLLLLEQILSMVLMAFSGFVLGRMKLVTAEQSRVLSCICVYLVLPSSMISSFSSQARDPERMLSLAVGLVCAVLVHVVYLAANWLLRRVLTREEQACVMYNNAGNLILPIVQNLLGPEYVLYTSPYLLVQNILLWTHAQTLMGGDSRLTVRKVVTTPGVAGILIGLFLYLTGIPLPGPLSAAMSSMSACMGPLSMLVTGLVLSSLDLKSVFLGTRIYAITAMRLLVYPALSLGILVAAARLFPGEEIVSMLTVLMLDCVGPVASTVLQQAQLFRNPEAGYVSSVSTLTTLLCALTIPAMLLVFQAMT